MSQIFTSFTKDEVQDMIRAGIKSAMNKDAEEEKPLPSQQVFLNTKEACALLRVSKPTLYKRMKDGTVPFFRIGKNIRFDKGALLKSVKNMEVNDGKQQ